MMRMMSRPRQWLLVVNHRQSLYWPMAGILRQLEGCNQGLEGLDYRGTRHSGAQRSGFPSHHYTWMVKSIIHGYQTGLSVEP